MKLSIIGSGSFGTSIAIHLSDNANRISIWGNNPAVINEINTHRTNKQYLKDIDCIPSNVYATSNLNECVEGSKYIILAVPSQAIKSVSAELKGLLNENQIIVNLAKGLDLSSLDRLSTIIKKEANFKNVVVLSGPSHAEEILLKIPTTITASSEILSLAEEVQNDLSTETLRIYTNPDIIGVEIGGASKNIIALAAGILDGLGYGDNSKAALMVRGMNEIISIGTHLGGDLRTFNGLSGIGDLIVTCTSKHSRNRQAGIEIASGKSLEDTLETVFMTVEGVSACQSFYKIAKQHNIEMPITFSLYNVLFNNADPEDEIKKLLNRDKKSEY